MKELNKNTENIREMFDSIAHKYDFLNHFCSVGIDRSWRKKVVRELRKSEAETLLDVATGTADLAIAAARGCPRLQITGIDLSEGMLEIGRKKVAAAGLENRIGLLQGDALHIDAETDRFDATTVAFGVRNFEDLYGGLCEMRRVLRPGGRLYVLELSIPRQPLLAALYRFYFRRILPIIGKVTSRNAFAYSYLPESVLQFPSGEKFLRILETAGYRHPEEKPLTFGIATLYKAVK